MPDVFTKAKRSEVMSRIRGRGNRDTELRMILQDQAAARPCVRTRGWSEFLEIEVIARQAEVFDDVGDDSARHVTRVPRERDEAIGAKWVGVMPVAARGAEKFAADFAQPLFELAA